MIFNSFPFLVFFPLVAMIYFLLPEKYRWIWLLASSYYFYMNWNAIYAILLALVTLVTWLSGIVIAHFENSIKIKKIVVAGSVIINLSILAYYKYFMFFIDTANKVLNKVGGYISIPEHDIILPVGISFFMFQALSYTIDIYRGEIEPEYNIFRYALFVSFFPQLVAGPIERSKNLLKQLRKPTKFSYINLQKGFLLILWGYFLKMVVADNASVVVDTVYSDIDKYPGWYVIVATVLFAFQIYGDFGGYSLIAIGTARILGFNLMVNFDSPYYASSVAEFWRRWHISLSSWFRDYLYIPMGGNRKGDLRKKFNLMTVFLVSGFWHGAAWHYVAWGGFNGVFQIIGSMTQGVRDKIRGVLKWDNNSFSCRVIRILTTFIFIDFCWIFFRAEGLRQAVQAIHSICTVHNSWILVDGSLYTLGLTNKHFRMLIYMILILMAVDYMKYKQVDIAEHIFRQPVVMRALLYAVLVIVILIFGHWGGGYSETSFIYFQF